MSLTNVSTREFRENLKEYFDKAEAGEAVFVKRKNQTFMLLPIDEDIMLTKETARSHIKDHYKEFVRETASKFIEEEVRSLIEEKKANSNNI